MKTEYPYSAGDPFRDRFEYAYTEYEGPAFLAGWRDSRSAAMETIARRIRAENEPHRIPSANNWFNDLGAAIQRRDAQAIALFDVVMRRFEFSKRVCPEYDADGQPLDRTDFEDLGCYVRFSSILEERFRSTGNLRYLNALLKALDICCAYATRIQDGDCQQLITLIHRESGFVEDLRKP